MRLEISAADDIYSHLEMIKESSSGQEAGIIVQDDMGRKTAVSPCYAFSSHPVELMDPLKFAMIYLRSQSGFYEMTVLVGGRNGYNFSKVSSRFGASCDNKKNLWTPLEREGVGYLRVGGEKRPIISIAKMTSEEGIDGDVRAISLGGYGAEPRRISEDLGDFMNAVGGLQNVVNLFVKACYDSSDKRRQSYKSSNVALSLNVFP